MAAFCRFYSMTPTEYRQLGLREHRAMLLYAIKSTASESQSGGE